MQNKLVLGALTALNLLTPSVRAADEPCLAAAKLQEKAAKGVEVPRPYDAAYLVQFDAETAYKCITSVPFNKDAAVKVLEISKSYFQFHSTLAYLKDPPASYQQESVDVMSKLDEFTTKAKNGEYKNLYEFDLDFYRLAQATHESHFSKDSHVLGLFRWTLDDTIVSVSTDGKALPQVYAASDINNNVNSPSAIAGSNANLTLNQYFSGQDIYDLKVVKANSTQSDDSTVETRRRKKRSYNPDVKLVKRADSSDDEVAVPYAAWPTNPIVVQDNFTFGGTVSGYYFDENQLGVLSIPSFDTDENSSETFDLAVASFINQTRSRGAKRIVIDLTGNGGGTLWMGYDTFRHFFPKKVPNLLWRTRAHSALNVLGSVLGWSGAQNTSYEDVPDINYQYGSKPDLTKFSSWKEFYGPRELKNDKFTSAATYDFTDKKLAGELGFYLAGYGDNIPDYDEAFPAENIVLLVDGGCGSTCSSFSTLMKHVANVRTVAVGGIPEYGPMQGVASTRGSMMREWNYFGDAITYIRSVLEAVDESDKEDTYSKIGISSSDVDNLPKALADSPWTVDGAINMFDTIQAGNQDTPRQFLYEASACRIFYTGEMIRDVSKLWQAVGTIAGGDNSTCVSGSQNAVGSKPLTFITDSPGFGYSELWSRANSTDVPNVKTDDTSSNSTEDSAASSYRVGLPMAVVAIAATLLL
ncbi:unnamed protein product [Clonostachys rosea f. rosea IK726]|uniref:Uncharacterized protein n=1 Tax=Clonostachys rosea f. rosea IK726 TaxID=1349383 RepID=A0ACA9TPR3_BIOOC|nr:unnamed protein product [Clonostachys rosea f. rosea IK726]